MAGELEQITRTNLIHNDTETPLGRVMWAGTTHVRGPYLHPSMQFLGVYALIYIVRGRGTYRNSLKASHTIGPGNLITLFPDIGHQYGPDAGEDLEEFFLAFKGPLFDLWRRQGLLDPGQPVVHLEPLSFWDDKIRAVVEREPDELPEPMRLIGRLSEFMAEVQVAQRQAAVASGQAQSPTPWLPRARAMLTEKLDQRVEGEDVARTLGLPYDSFRRQFRRQTGLSPAQYRSNQRIAAGADLLLHSTLGIKQIASSLGFCSEFHFSQRFKQLKGLSPRDFRRRGG